jgi:hypothetical protein
MMQVLVFIGLLTTALISAAGDVKPIAPSKEFDSRLAEYVKLKEKVVSGFAEPVKKDDAQLIEARKLAAANAVREARSSARQGDLFTPETAEQIRRVIRSELKGPAGSSTRKTTKQGNPTAEGTPFVPKVNVLYPKEAPLSTVPPTVLLRLPQLPKGIEYRFVGKTMILYDADTRLILDLLPNALP